MGLEPVGGGRWVVRDGDEVAAEHHWDELRFSVSWKAYCFADEQEQATWRDHADDLDARAWCWTVLVADLRERGAIDGEVPEDPDLSLLIIDTYIHFPGPGRRLGPCSDATRSPMVGPDEALPGRSETMPLPAAHDVLGTPLAGPFPEGTRTAVFGMGCFWGAERKFWELGDGIVTTAVGYAGGHTPNPTYEEVCSGRTGHTEVVLVAYDPAKLTFDTLLTTFWENHDPTQGMRQGNDVGTQYRSAIYTDGPDQLEAAQASLKMFQERLQEAGLRRHHHRDPRTRRRRRSIYAEPYHQQYLAKNPDGLLRHRRHRRQLPRRPRRLTRVAPEDL